MTIILRWVTLGIVLGTGVKMRYDIFALDKEFDALWDYLVEGSIATKDELALVTSINGSNIESLESVLYSRTGYRSLKQILEVDDEKCCTICEFSEEGEGCGA